MDSDSKAVTIMVVTGILCVAGLVCLAMVQNHVQTLKYIEGGYSQQQTNFGPRWVKE